MFYRLLKLFAVFSLSFNTVSGLTNRDLAKIFQVVKDGPEHDDEGYGNGNMSNNGESLMLNLINSEDLLFDVGAHTGEWSLSALSVQPSVSIYCFEPIPSIFSALETNLQGMPVILNKLALSDTKGVAAFFHYLKHPGMSTLHRRPEIEQILEMKPEIFDVNLERLDAFCQQNKISHINFMKIDTEGNEFKVLSGAEKLLEEQAIDIIQFEYGGCYLDSKSTLKQVYFYLTSFDYTVYRITNDGLIEITQWRNALENFTYSNYLAISHSKTK